MYCTVYPLFIIRDYPCTAACFLCDICRIFRSFREQLHGVGDAWGIFLFLFLFLFCCDIRSSYYTMNRLMKVYDFDLDLKPAATKMSMSSCMFFISYLLTHFLFQNVCYLLILILLILFPIDPASLSSIDDYYLVCI